MPEHCLSFHLKQQGSWGIWAPISICMWTTSESVNPSKFSGWPVHKCWEKVFRPESQRLTGGSVGLSWIAALIKRIWLATNKVCHSECVFDIYKYNKVDSEDDASELGHTKLGICYIGSSSQWLFKCETNNNKL